MDIHFSQLRVMKKGIKRFLKGISASLKMAAFIPSLPPGRGMDHMSLLKSFPSQPFGAAPNRTYCSSKSARALGTRELRNRQDHLSGSLPSPPPSSFSSSLFLPFFFIFFVIYF